MNEVEELKERLLDLVYRSDLAIDAKTAIKEAEKLRKYVQEPVVSDKDSTDKK